MNSNLDKNVGEQVTLVEMGQIPNDKANFYKEMKKVREDCAEDLKIMYHTIMMLRCKACIAKIQYQEALESSQSILQVVEGNGFSAPKKMKQDSRSS